MQKSKAWSREVYEQVLEHTKNGATLSAAVREVTGQANLNSWYTAKKNFGKRPYIKKPKQQTKFVDVEPTAQTAKASMVVVCHVKDVKELLNQMIGDTYAN